MLCLGLLSTSFTVLAQQSIQKDNTTIPISIKYYAVGDIAIGSFTSRNNNFQKSFPSGNTTDPDVYSLSIAGNRYEITEGDSITKGATPEISFSNRFQEIPFNLFQGTPKVGIPPNTQIIQGEETFTIEALRSIIIAQKKRIKFLEKRVATKNHK